MNLPLRFAAILLVALASGCGALPSIAPGDEARQLDDLLAWSQRVAKATPEAQRRELNAASQAMARQSEPLARLRLATLLALPGAAVADDAKAMSLLEPFATQAVPAGPLQRFGAALHAQLGERLREQKRAQQYREQIDALRALERSLRQRGEAQGK